MSVILSVHELTKHYPKQIRAVNGVSFSMREGQCFGLLGPNGAGKSTTIEMLEGLLQPTSGEIRFRGRPIKGADSADYRERIGIQFQTTALQDFLTVRENLRFFGQLYAATRPIEELIKVCRLEEFLDRDSRKLSGGQRQRLLLALALINDPELIFLDEPTTGLDPQARRNFWELIQDIKRAGKTILLTTHYMEEAYVLCDEIAIMDHGRLIRQGSPAGLLADHFNDSVLELPAAEAARLGDEFPLIPRGEFAEIHTADVNGVVARLLAVGASLAQLRIRPRTLEDLFIELTGKELRA
jgi:ABC-2 type transport system ATP-binding protein